MLKAAAALGSENGYDAISATAVVARAGVSRKTFYDIFESREDCFAAVIQEALAEMLAVAAPVYEEKGRWAARLRAALAALLAFLERENTGALALSCLVGYGPKSQEIREHVLERVQALVDEGRSQARAYEDLSPLTADVVVGGVLAVVHARSQSRPRQMMALLNPLMWMIVLPYLGPSEASRELTRSAPKHAAVPAAHASDPPRGLDMRLTYRTARVLEVIGVLPGANNRQIGARAGVKDQGQISKLLARLADLELIENTGHHYPANSWRLTPSGHALESAIRRDPLAAGGARARRSHA
jgi:AcrR family transcriptional regulator